MSAWEFRRDGKYLAALRQMEADYDRCAGYDNRSMLRGQLSQFFPVVGDVVRALLWEDQGVRKDPASSSPPRFPDLDAAEPRDALESIVEMARSRQIVILNEAHNVSQNRAFGMQVALALRKLGFRYFAAETFTPQIMRTPRKAFPTRADGYYTDDPVFGDFVRQALRSGFEPVAYEDQGTAQGDMYDRINARETAQARNLMDGIFKKHPAARVFIYVGYAHAEKVWRRLPDGREAAWMAARLKRLTGVDPLTIDQTAMREHSSPRCEAAAYRQVMSQKGPGLRVPTVFETGHRRWWVGGNYSGRVDMQVFHPRTRFVQGRPDYLRLGGYRKPFLLKPTWLPERGRRLVQAFVASEPDDAIPMDQIVLTRKLGAPCLLLPSGSYRIVLQDEDGNSRILDTIRQP